MKKGSKSMVILCTGIAGVEKENYLKEVQKTLRQIYGKKSRIHRVETTVKGEKAKNIWELQTEEARAEALKDAWTSIQEKIQKEKNTVHIIEFHAVLWRPFGFLYTQFEVRDIIRKIRPDFIVTLINNITDTRWNLQKMAEKGDQESSMLGFRDVILWRANEINFSRLLAQFLFEGEFRKKYFILATGHDYRTIADIVALPECKKAYVAFPVRHLETIEEKEKEKWQKDIKKFVDLVNQYCVVFNPYTIYEKEILKLLTISEPERSAEVFNKELLRGKGGLLEKNMIGKQFLPEEEKLEEKKVPSCFNITIWEIAQVLRDIDAQIEDRDRSMVEQSDMVIAFHPNLSKGARKEVNWGLQYPEKLVLAIGPRAELTGLFNDLAPKYIFPDIAGLREWYKKEKFKRKPR